MAAKGLLLIPAYNEEASIGAVLDEACKFWPREDIVVVDDGSRDRTCAIVSSRGIAQITHPTNLGYAAALQTGVLYAMRRGYEYLVKMDADGQHEPRFLHHLAEELSHSGADLVVGSRFGSREVRNLPPGRRLGMWLFARLTRLLVGQHVTDTSSGMKAFHSRIFPELQGVHLVDFHAELLVYLMVRGYVVKEVPVTMRARQAGSSMHNWATLLVYPAKTILGIVLGLVEARRRGVRQST